MRSPDSLADVAEAEIQALKEKGRANGWRAADIALLFETYDRWMDHPQFLDSENDLGLRIIVLNEVTFLISEPIIGDVTWEYIREIAKRLGREDPHFLRVSWCVATFELAAEPPEYPEFLEKLFSLAADKDTRWAVFDAYDNFPWLLRPHAHKYSKGLVSDQDCDQWLLEQALEDDEILGCKRNGEEG